MSYCSIQGCGRPFEGATDKCASHNHEARKQLRMASKEKKVYVIPRDAKIKPLELKKHKPIPKVSGKMARMLQEYSKLKKPWIKGKMCAVLKNVPATDIHHKKGRVGFADKFARDNDIPLLLDERYWLPVSRAGHIKIELLPEWAKEQGFSLSRSEKID